MRSPLVSVVVSTRNEEQSIQKCLESITNQSYPSKSIEIIVVDNFSTDRTVSIAKKYTSSIYLKGNERSTQRNYGIREKAKGKYALFLDADMRLSKHVIRSCVEKLEQKNEITSLYILEEIVGNSLWSKVRNFERSFFTATPIDAVRFFRRKDFIAIGGFDEKLRAFEDWDLTKRLKLLGQFSLVKEPLFHDETLFSFQTYIRKKISYDKDYSLYVTKWGRNDADIKKQLGLFYRSIGVFIENGKWKKIVSSPYYFLGICILRSILFLCIVESRLWRKL
ncbi:glycosyltransferase [Candidatus Gottesmanbacteria bacterium]|nr:glycosyltransferase [Candidatus Gottesmanbacteria bacterium]